MASESNGIGFEDAMRVTIIRGGRLLLRENDEVQEALRSLEDGDFVEILDRDGTLRWGRCVDRQLAIFGS